MSDDSRRTWRLEAVPGLDMHFWAEMLGDPNPIHIDASAARELGFGDATVNPGPTNLAYVLNLIADEFDSGTPSELEARFSGNVLAGDTVEAGFSRLEGREGQVELRRLPLGETVLEATFAMPKTER
ncbi:hypothetical protein GCM10011371_29830 [Novosphingobium marinum]|uniref:Acyl dehydratase n=1 Tax=Novosphingobium marinum TaxID=1514948 RepID=A0A7Z0BWU6_9SPHN|nr:MaoC family dehydratase [Novosphingobium marinum]NYH96755.1 acyl dehydratase [Novosphingobium marinum]GGC40469.1 hypothetical protein GCM10011371_29830 [Novosphingobium marinum]